MSSSSADPTLLCSACNSGESCQRDLQFLRLGREREKQSSLVELGRTGSARNHNFNTGAVGGLAFKSSCSKLEKRFAVEHRDRQLDGALKESFRFGLRDSAGFDGFMFDRQTFAIDGDIGIELQSQVQLMSSECSRLQIAHTTGPACAPG